MSYRDLPEGRDLTEKLEDQEPLGVPPIQHTPSPKKQPKFDPFEDDLGSKKAATDIPSKKDKKPIMSKKVANPQPDRMPPQEGEDVRIWRHNTFEDPHPERYPEKYAKALEIAKRLAYVKAGIYFECGEYLHLIRPTDRERVSSKWGAIRYDRIICFEYNLRHGLPSRDYVIIHLSPKDKVNTDVPVDVIGAALKAMSEIRRGSDDVEYGVDFPYVAQFFRLPTLNWDGCYYVEDKRLDV